MDLKNWQNLLEAEPDNDLVRFTVAKGHMELGDFAEALGHLKTLLEFHNEYTMAWVYLLRCYIALDQKDEARQLAAQALPILKAQNHKEPLEEFELLLEELDAEF